MPRKGDQVAGSGVTPDSQQDEERGRPARRPECDRAVSLAQGAGFLLALRDGATVEGAAATGHPRQREKSS